MGKDILVECNPDHCGSHQYMERTMDRLEQISERLTTGQQEIIVLIKDVSRLGERVDKLEAGQDEVKKFMYKVMGVVAVSAFVAPLLVSWLFKPA